MNTVKDQVDSKSSILLDTKYAVEEFDLTWRVANYSQLFDTVHADYSLKNNMTAWQLRLINKRSIHLSRRDRGEPVNVELKYILVTRYKIFQGNTFHKFLNESTVQVLSLDVYERGYKDGERLLIEFENDTLVLCCTIKVIGPSKTKIIKSEDFLKPSLEKLSEDLRKLLNNREHCDLKISTGNKVILVHKVILCARSKVFERMFQNDMLESKNQLIELCDLEFEVVENFITFLYSGEVQMLSLDKAMKLYYVADKYEVEDLRKKCSSYLEFNLSVDEACTILKFADLHGDEKLKNAVTFYIQMHAAEIKLTDNWKDFVKEDPKIALDVFK